MPNEAQPRGESMRPGIPGAAFVQPNGTGRVSPSFPASTLVQSCRLGLALWREHLK